jgi:hypothetical protein
MLSRRLFEGAVKELGLLPIAADQAALAPGVTIAAIGLIASQSANGSAAAPGRSIAAAGGVLVFMPQASGVAAGSSSSGAGSVNVLAAFADPVLVINQGNWSPRGPMRRRGGQWQPAYMRRLLIAAQ